MIIQKFLANVLTNTKGILCFIPPKYAQFAAELVKTMSHRSARGLSGVAEILSLIGFSFHRAQGQRQEVALYASTSIIIIIGAPQINR